MGQCYAITLKGTIDKKLLVKLTNQYKTTTRGVRWNFNEIKTFNEALAEIFTTMVEYIEHIDQDIEALAITSAFDASYGWEPVMTNWFEFVAPAFSTDTVLEILPDEGLTKCWIENGKVLVFEGSWDFLVDETPEYKELYDKICAANPSFTEKQKSALKQYIGEHGGEVDDIEGEYEDLFTGEQYKSIYDGGK